MNRYLDIRNGALALTIILVTSAHAESVRQFGRGCLTFNPSELNMLGAERGTAHYRAPLFYFQLDTSEEYGQETRLGIVFQKMRDTSHEARFALSTRLLDQCQRGSIENELIPLLNSDASGCFVLQNEILFLPTESAAQDHPIEIRCRIESNNNCSLDYMMPNNWRAIVFLPRELLPIWRMIPPAIEKYFSDNFIETEC